MSDILKVFLGADSRRADSPELKRLGEISVKEGFVRFINTVTLENEITNVDDVTEVIIRGGWAEACVGAAVDYFLGKGVPVVICDLPNIRSSDEIYGNFNSEEKINRVTLWMKSDPTKVQFIY